MSDQAKEIIKTLTVEEKAKLCSGMDFWHLEGLKQFNLDSIMVTDGPHGLRKQLSSSDHIGITESVPSTCFPTAVGLASTWDNQLITQVGVALGEECLEERVSVLLGPGTNIKRHPLCGRNFEYFSEDPYLSGTLSTNYINGVQSMGIGTSLKHFVANNQETMRMVVNACIDERTLRELYLKPFEIAVKTAQPWTVMCSYNKVNGQYLSEHTRMLQDILKDEWNHQGLVVTDWGACNDRVMGINAGQDLEMPGSNGMNDTFIVNAVRNGTLEEEILNQRVERVLDLIIRSNVTLQQEKIIYDKEKHHEFARQVAAESIVLLKNKDDILPLSPTTKIGLIGEFAVSPRYQGSGSSLINPTKITSAYNALQELIGDEFFYAQGYHSNEDILNEQLIEEAVSVASTVDTVILMIGLTDVFESEGFDREHLEIPTTHTVLLNRLLEVNKNIIVCLSNGSPIEMPWKDNVPAILEQYLGGQASGGALIDVLFGKVNPSGKLAETFPNRITEFPSNQQFPGRPRQVEYREGLYIGYRYYDTAQIEPLFPFGYGLSYTSFEYSTLQTETTDDSIQIEFTIQNTGSRKGKEIAQIYISKSDSVVYRPYKELKGYDKIELEPDQSKVVQIDIPLESIAIYNEDEFKVESGTYTVLIGASSKDIRLSSPIEIGSEDLITPDHLEPYHNVDSTFTPTLQDFEQLYGQKVPVYPDIKPYTLNSTLGEMKPTFIGKKLYSLVAKELTKMTGDTEHISPGMIKMIEKSVDEMPFRALVTMGGDALSLGRALGMLDLMNKKFIRGLWKILRD